jgi:hypothetical protein
LSHAGRWWGKFNGRGPRAWPLTDVIRHDWDAYANEISDLPVTLHRYVRKRRELETRAQFGVDEKGRVRGLGGKMDDITVVVARVQGGKA